MVRVKKDDTKSVVFEKGVEVFPESSRSFKANEQIFLRDRKIFEAFQEILESLMGIVQREAFGFLAFLIEEEVTARFLRDVNAEVKHGAFSFLLGDDSKQVPPCNDLTHIAWEINGPLISTEGHSILNEYSQLDQQEAVVFGKWSLEAQSHKEESNRQACSKTWI